MEEKGTTKNFKRRVPRMELKMKMSSFKWSFQCK